MEGITPWWCISRAGGAGSRPVAPYSPTPAALRRAFDGLVPDLYRRMPDGATPQEALASTQEAIDEWIEGSEELGRTIPEPGSAARRAVEAGKAMRGKPEEAFTIQAGLEERFTALEAEIADLHEKADDRCRRH